MWGLWMVAARCIAPAWCVWALKTPPSSRVLGTSGWRPSSSVLPASVLVENVQERVQRDLQSVSTWELGGGGGVGGHAICGASWRHCAMMSVRKAWDLLMSF